MHFLIGAAILWLIIEAIRALRKWRAENEFVRRVTAPGAGITHGMTGAEGRARKHRIAMGYDT